MAHKTRLLPLFAAVLLAIGAPRAFAQGPFLIDGIVTDANNSGVPAPPAAPGSTKTTDPNGGAKELGPKNSNSTKIGVIHNAALPMLDTTNPNGQTDLNTIYTQSAVVGTDLWFYFGWRRDANSGSGFISIELQKNAPPAACAYGSATEAQLIANCNPWANRSDNDLLILWDQQGGSLNVYARLYNEALGGFGPPQLLPPNAQYTADGFGGEAQVNISALVAGQANQCVSFANIIPGTVTGNSDTADYKDTVLALFPSPSNCGTITVTKVTQNGLGQTITGTGPFPFTLDATDPIFGAAADSDCTVSGASLNVCSGSLAQGGSSVSIANLLSRSNYSLTEGTIDPKWELISITCDGNNVMNTTFTLTAGQTRACVITNRLKQGKLVVKKIVINDNGGTLAASAFTIDLNFGGTTSTTPGNEAGAEVTLKVLATRPDLTVDSTANAVPAANWIEREMIRQG